MKKLCAFLILCVPLLLFVGCGAKESKDTPDTPNAKPPAIMVNSTIYYSTGKEIVIEIDESEFLGHISSVISIAKLPSEDGQANIPYEGAPYAKYQEGIVVLMDDVWIFFEAR